MAAVLCIVGGLLGGVALARVSPINQIGRQVQKGNMLVIMDTSGSMTGVPGEIFDINTELGVDCELGQNCRTVDKTGRCSLSTDPISGLKRICANDAHCQTGRCRDGGDPCLQDDDCPTSGTRCSQSGEVCQYNSDCGPVFQQCTGGQGICSSLNPNSCPAIGTCAGDGSICLNPGGRCPASFCSNDPMLPCTTNSDCGMGGSQIPAAGLVVHYPFEETSGSNVNDTSANNLDGTQLGDQTWWADGKVDRSLEFGWGDSVLIPDGAGIDSIGANNKLTLSAWINPTSSNWNHIASRQIAGTGFHHFFMRTHSNKIYFGICTASGCDEVASTVSVPTAGGWPTFSATNWTHVVGTFDGTTIALYINGTAAGTATTSRAMAADTTPVYVGALNRVSDGLGGYFGGLMDEFRLYNTALSASDVQAIYQQTIPPTVTPPPPGSGLIGHWTMDESNLTNRDDTSGNGNHLLWQTGFQPWTDSSYKTEGSAALGGGGDLWAAPSASLNTITTGFTLAGWHRRDSDPSGDMWLISRDTIPGQSSFSSGQQQFSLRVGPANRLYCFTIANDAFGTCFGGTSDTSLGVWQHVAVTWDGQRFRAFLDGVKVQDVAAAVTLATATGPFRFGKDAGDLFYDDWYLYNRALSQHEIIKLTDSIGLIGEWKFEETSGDPILDTSGQSQHGTMKGATGPERPTRTTGVAGNAIYFPSNYGFIEIPNSPTLNQYILTNRFTFLSWWKPSSLRWGAWAHRFNGLAGPNDRTSIDLGMGSPTTDNIFVQNQNNTSGVSPATKLAVGKWSHVAGTFDQNVARIWIDAVSSTPGSPTSGGLFHPTSEPLLLGQMRRWNATMFEYKTDAHGTMDDARLYNRVLTGPEMAVQGLKAGLVTYQSFDTGGVTNGTTVGTLNTVDARRFKGLRWDNNDANYVEIGPNASTGSINTNKAISVAMWVKRTAGGSQDVLMHQQHSTGSAEAYWFNIRPDDRLEACGVVDDTAFPIGTWTHVAFAMDQAQYKCRFWKNGVEDNQSVAGLNPGEGFTVNNALGAIRIGVQRDNTTVSGAFNGEIDEFYVYNRMLSGTEVAVLAEEPINTYVTPPINPVENTEALLAHWRLDGTTVDSSGNNNHLLSVCGTPGYETGYAGQGVTLTQGSQQASALMSPGALLDGKTQYSISLFMRNRGGFTADHQNLIARQTAVGDAGQSFQVMAANSNHCPEFSVCGTRVQSRLWSRWSNQFDNPKRYEATTWPSTWTHFAATVDTSTGTVKWYKNGSIMKNSDNADIVFTDSALQAAITGRPLVFGSHKSGPANDDCSLLVEGANFSMDDIRVYGRILPPSEIGQLATGQPPTTTTFCAENNCNPTPNDCPGSVAQNICTGSSVNACEGVNTGDLCIVTSTNPGPARMCQFGMTLCTVDADCTAYTGDQCVPSTSRAVVAKRVLKNTMLRNTDVMNFGLMTFSQGRPTTNLATFPSGREDYYFPYYPQVGGSPVVTQKEIRFFPRQQLEDIPVSGAPKGVAFDRQTGPVPSFVERGIAYQMPTLPPYSGANSRYAIYQGSGNYANVDKSWDSSQNCESYCDIIVNTAFNFGNNDDNDSKGTGVYQGTYYEFTVSVTTTNQFSNAPKFLTTYQGRDTLIGGVLHNYFKPKTDYYWDPQAGANRPGISGPINCEYTSTCSDTCGAWWDPTLMPSIYTGTDLTIIDTNLKLMLARLEKASDGGLMMWERTPIGCALKNDGAQMYNPTTGLSNGASMPQSTLSQMKKYSAYHHIKDAMIQDPLDCRENFIVMLTDGLATGPGDVYSASGDYGDSRCDDLVCRPIDPNTDPAANGCTCRAVNAAYRIRKDIEVEVEAARVGTNFKPVKTYVVGFSPDATVGPAEEANDNIARAGGTCAGSGFKCAFRAKNEIQLTESLQSVVFEAIKGSYSTSPLTAASGVQQPDSIIASTIVLDSRVDFPAWEGHLIAYETDAAACATQSATAPCILWDSTSVSRAAWGANGWMDRNIYFWDHITDASNPVLKKIVVDKSVMTDPKISNRVLLNQLGLGATPEEAQTIALWMMGDPEQGNKALFGAFVNSTPTDVGPPGASRLPGGKAFHDAYVNRPNLIYVGSDDGMLHAFYKRQTTLGAKTFAGGTEAFAFLPPEMLKTITKLYAQGGQMADPMQHVYGLAQSPKVKNLCATPSATDPFCGSDSTAMPYWKTFLSMTSGWGENEAWMIDITNAFDGNAGTPTALQDPPFRVVWHSDFVSLTTDRTKYNEMLGNVASVPAFYFGKNSNNNDQRMIFTSGYQNVFDPHPDQGLYVTSVSALDGHIIDSDPLPPSSPSCGNGIERTALTDVATARNFAYTEKGQILAGYFGDTWGNLYRYVPVVGGTGDTTASGAVGLVNAFGCDAPLHFSPAIVQLDRDDPANHAGQIYIVQVTNSTLDKDTQGFGRSKLVIRKDRSLGGLVAPDSSFTTISYQMGDPTLCANWDDVAKTCTTLIPNDARPTATPMAVLKADGSGFQIFTLWYSGSNTGCGQGVTYLTLHEITSIGGVTVKAGLTLTNQPVTSAIITGDKVLFSKRGTNGAAELVDITSQLNQTFVVGGAISPNTLNGGLRYKQTGWNELP